MKMQLLSRRGLLFLGLLLIALIARSRSEDSFGIHKCHACADTDDAKCSKLKDEECGHEPDENKTSRSLSQKMAKLQDEKTAAENENEGIAGRAIFNPPKGFVWMCGTTVGTGGELDGTVLKRCEVGNVTFENRCVERYLDEAKTTIRTCLCFKELCNGPGQNMTDANVIHVIKDSTNEGASFKSIFMSLAFGIVISLAGQYRVKQFG